MTTRDDSAAGQFFGLVLILSLPFCALGTTGVTLHFAPALPISAIMACVPMSAALILVTRQNGVKAASGLFASAFRVRTTPNILWALVALAVMPVAFLVTGGIVWLSGIALPDLHLFPASAIIPAFALFFLGAVGEEIGWQSYAYPALAGGHSALTAALTVGVAWALWHVIPFVLMELSAIWIFWQSFGMVFMRIIIVWLVVNTGQSILIAVQFHMMSNSVWGVFPDFAPWYDPKVMWLVLLAPVILIVAVLGPNSLGRFRYG